jgi:adenosylcobyric acid synthase
VFAQLYGTIALLEPEERKRIRGTVINKFRGDAEILRPGLRMLEELTGVPVLGVIPYTDVDIDDEDSLSGRLNRRTHEKPIDIAVIRLPRISNFTDFAPLEEHPLLGVRYVSSRSELGRPDMIILPGTKNTMGDLRWLRESGLEGQILRLASADTPVLGVCGGFQMLGKAISDPCGVEEGGEIAGMGLLPVRTSFSGEKMRTRVRASVFAGPFAGAELSAYEIHMGRTIAEEGTEPFAVTEPEDSAGEDGFPPESLKKENAGYVDGAYAGNVFGTYLHGLFDSGELTERLAEYLCTRRGIDAAAYKPESRAAYRERQYEKLAKCVRESLDLEIVYRIIFEGKN